MKKYVFVLLCLNYNYSFCVQILFQYSAVKSGQYGGGGEYDIQTGFGWTNGVALHLLDKYGDKLSSTDEQLLESTHGPPTY